MIRANDSNDPPPGHSPGPPLTERLLSTPLPLTSMSSKLLSTQMLSGNDVLNSDGKDEDKPLHQLHNVYPNNTSINTNQTNHNDNSINNNSTTIEVDQVNSYSNISGELLSNRSISKIETINVWFNDLLKNASISNDSTFNSATTASTPPINPSSSDEILGENSVIADVNNSNRTQSNGDTDGSVRGASLDEDEDGRDCEERAQENWEWDAKIANQSRNSTFPQFDFQFELQNNVFQVLPNHVPGINCGTVYEGKSFLNYSFYYLINHYQRFFVIFSSAIKLGWGVIRHHSYSEP